jgi:hypothetical protein
MLMSVIIPSVIIHDDNDCENFDLNDRLAPNGKGAKLSEGKGLG